MLRSLASTFCAAASRAFGSALNGGPSRAVWARRVAAQVRTVATSAARINARRREAVMRFLSDRDGRAKGDDNSGCGVAGSLADARLRSTTAQVPVGQESPTYVLLRETNERRSDSPVRPEALVFERS